MVTAAHLSVASAPHSSDEVTGKEKQSLLFALGAMPLRICAFAVSCYRKRDFFLSERKISFRKYQMKVLILYL